MKLTIILFLTIIIVNCNRKYSNTDITLEIKVINQHPFLVDHDKQLIIYAHGLPIHKELLHMDTGSGSPCSLFKNYDDFILIDSNGVWYTIRNGIIVSKIWSYFKELPKDYICTYKFIKNVNGYEKTFIRGISKKDVYLYKDPFDYLNKRDFEMDKQNKDQ